LLAACVTFALSAAGSSTLLAIAVLMLAAGLQSLAEMLQASGSWEISFDLTPPGKHGQYQGFFTSGFTVARMLGPLLVTTLIISWGTIGWLLLGGLFLAAGLATVPAVRVARARSRENSLV
jgi:MFS family permease